MSVISVRVKADQIELAGDSQTSWGNHKFVTFNSKDPVLNQDGKLFEVNGMTVGCAGATATISLFKLFCKTAKPKSIHSDDILEWLVTFKDFCEKKYKHTDISIHAILIMDGQAVAVYDFLDIYPISDFWAVGSGAWLAIGAMECGVSAADSVKVACKYDKGCGGDITTKTVKK